MTFQTQHHNMDLIRGSKKEQERRRTIPNSESRCTTPFFVLGYRLWMNRYHEQWEKKEKTRKETTWTGKRIRKSNSIPFFHGNSHLSSLLFSSFLFFSYPFLLLPHLTLSWLCLCQVLSPWYGSWNLRAEHRGIRIQRIYLRNLRHDFLSSKYVMRACFENSIVLCPVQSSPIQHCTFTAF